MFALCPFLHNLTRLRSVQVKTMYSNLLFVERITGSASGEKFCHVETSRFCLVEKLCYMVKFCHWANFCHVETLKFCHMDTLCHMEKFSFAVIFALSFKKYNFWLFCPELCCFVVICTVLLQYLFCRDLLTFLWRRKKANNLECG